MSEDQNPEPVQENSIEPMNTSANFAAPAKVGLNQAARLTGASKNTIIKYSEDGTLSYELNAQNRKVYQVAELQRVFPNMKVLYGSVTSSLNRREPAKSGSDQSNNTQELDRLRTELHQKEIELATEREKSRLLTQIAESKQEEAEKWHKQAERLSLMLPAPEAQKAPEPVPEPEKPKGFFSRIFGG
jgi:hypothetical protein